MVTGKFLNWFRAGVLVGAVCLVSACGAKEEKAAETEPVVTVDVAPVLTSTIELKVGGDAVLYPLAQAAIAPKITAPVKKFYAERGAHVHAGDLLAELENQDLAGAVKEKQAAYEQAEATYQNIARAEFQELQKAELDVRAGKENMDALQKLYDSRMDLYKQGAIAQKDVNEAQVNLGQARNQYEIAKKHFDDLQSFGRDQELKAAIAQRDAVKAHLESAQALLAYSRVISPIDGVVSDRPVYAGETAAAGASIITIMDLSQIVARAHISIQDAAQIKLGDPAHLVQAGVAPIDGKVTQISPALDPSSTTVEVWVQAANPDGRLKPGTGMRVEITARAVANALVIPYAAVLTSPSGSTSVMVVDAANKPHKKSVSLGIRDGGNVQITEGLESGERVVTFGAFALAKLDADVLEKTKVQIQPPKEEDDEDK